MWKVVIVVLSLIVALIAGYVYLNTATGTLGTQVQIVGLWRSTHDPRFTREFKNDGTVVDAYEGNTPNVPLRWAIFTKNMRVDGLSGEVVLEDGATYLALASPQSNSLYFEIAQLNADTLELVSLDRNGTLSFTKAK